MPRVVIGMPVYNGERYLAEALAGLSAQGFDDMKVVISDNASTDSTPDILSDFAARDKRITFQRQATGIPVMENYEWTMRHSESPYFCFAAYDDGWAPNYVEELWRCIEEKPGTVLAAPRVQMMDIHGAKGEIYPFAGAINDTAGVEQARLCMRHMCPSWFYGIFERESFIRAWDGSLRFKHVWGIDPVVLLPVLLSGKVAGSNETLFFRRATGSSDEKYRPATATAQAKLTKDFYAICLKILSESALSPMEKAALLPEIFSYGRYGGKIRRIWRLALKGKAA